MSLKVGSSTLFSFYRAIIESVLTQSITIWFDRAPKTEIDKLNSVIRNAERLVGVELPTLESIYVNRMRTKVDSIIKDFSHPAHDYFKVLPHGRRLRAFKGCGRFVNSFYPKAVKHYNERRQARHL